MQAVESQTLILYHTDLRGQWPAAAAQMLAVRLPYGKRLALGADGPQQHASLAGIALALRALGELLDRAVSPAELVFARGEKPRLARASDPGADFSISHSGPWVGCAALGCGRVGFDVEMGDGEQIASWVAREAALKAWGAGIRALRELSSSAEGIRCGGVLWHARALPIFPGASACAMMVRRFGGAVIRGSSTHTGARALRDYYQALVRDDISPVITPDGPRGPRFEFKPGALLLSQMSGRPVLPMAYAASRAWLIKWDKFVIPVPFSRIAIAIGPPFYVPRVTDAALLERLAGEMEGELKRLYGVARAALRAP